MPNNETPPKTVFDLLFSWLPSRDEKKPRVKHPLVELAKYPKASRAFTATAKGALAVLNGVAVASVLVLIGLSVHVFLIVALAVGGIGYAVKSIRDARNQNILELRLIKKLDDAIVALEKYLKGGDEHSELGVLQKNLDALDTNLSYLKKEELIELRSKIHYMMSSIDMIASEKNNYQPIKNKLSDKLKLIEHECQRREFSLPDSSAINLFKFEEPKPFSLWRNIKKFGNRAMSFLGGASLTAGVGVGIASIIFGVSNPAGWVLGGIIAASLLVGALSVTLDYYVSRRQTDKIEKLKQATQSLLDVHSNISAVPKRFAELNELCRTRKERQHHVENTARIMQVLKESHPEAYKEALQVVPEGASAHLTAEAHPSQVGEFSHRDTKQSHADRNKPDNDPGLGQ